METEKKCTTGDRLKEIMDLKNLKQIDILNLSKPYCDLYNVKLQKSDLSQYISGRSEPRQDKLSVLGLALNVSEVWLMGYDVPMERSPESEIPFPTNVYPVDKVKLPHLLHFIYKPLYKGLFYILCPIMCDLCTIFKVHNCNDQAVKKSENQYILIDSIGIY